MNYYTTDLYETKREIVNFSKKISEGVNKSTSKFVMDMMYGVSKSKSCLISEISRSLEEKINLNYTIESIDTVRSVLKRKCNMIFDRGYDDNKLIDYIDKNGDYFVIRMNDKRNFLFKGKKKNCYKEAIKRKGKVRMKLWFDDNEKYEVYVSHTRVTLPYNKKEDIFDCVSQM